jgi:hypothetical protein
MFLDWKSTGTFWLWLGIIELLLDSFWIGPSRFEFPYGLTYGFGFIAIGIVLSHTDRGKDEATVFGSLAAVLIGLIAVLVDATSGSGFLGAVTGAVLSTFLFFVVLAAELGHLGKRLPQAKYATIAVFIAWFFWPVMYFYGRLMYAFPLNLETTMYHGGIMILALIDAITFLGAWKFKQRDTLRALFFTVAVIGVLLTVGWLGWGLGLTA